MSIIMRIKENIRYRITANPEISVYLIKKGRHIRIMAHLNKDGENRERDGQWIWIKKDILDFKLLWEKKDRHGSFEGICYVIIKDIEGRGFLLDVMNPSEYLLSGFNYHSYKGTTKTFVYDVPMEFDEYEKEDRIIKFWDKRKKSFALYSLLKKKFIFGPIDYKDIEDLGFGVIIDDITYVENNGCTDDLSGYECIDYYAERIYYNKEKDDYMMLIQGEDNGLFGADKEDNIIKVETDNWIYKYNLDSKKFEYEQIYNNYMSTDEYLHQWDDYEDIAFEGYSREYLGID